MLLTTLLPLAFSSIPLLLASPTPIGLLPKLLPRAANTTKYCPSHPATEPQQRIIFNDFIQTLYGARDAITAFDTYVAINLIEHDPFDSQGRDANAAKLAGIVPYADFTVLRSSFDNDVGFVHLKIVPATGEPIAVADIYRMQGSCIVEHWDVEQARPDNATNPIAMF